MQHALLLMWVRAVDGLSEAQPSGTDGAKIGLSLEDYRSSQVVNMYRGGGGGEGEGRGGALSIHGNHILDGLSADQRRVAEIMFRRLTEVDDKREIRRPTSCGTVSLANVGLSSFRPSLTCSGSRNPRSSMPSGRIKRKRATVESH